jgi:serine phosphatase RsbU (regulator of sigma subunit)
MKERLVGEKLALRLQPVLHSILEARGELTRLFPDRALTTRSESLFAKVCMTAADPAVAFAVTLSAGMPGQPGAVTPFVIAVLVVTVYSGLAAGLLAGAASLTAIVYYLTVPSGWVFSRQTVTAAICFSAAATVAAVITNRLKRARIVAETARRETQIALQKRDQALEEIGRLYEQEREVARVLQHATFSRALPEVTGARLQAYYEPASDIASIGGDWFDAIEHTDGSISVVVGDISGKGIVAAAEMGRLSKTIRLYLADDPDPARVIERVNQGIERGIIADVFATAALATFNPTTGILRYASAGHPPPLTIKPDGSTRLLEEGRNVPFGYAATRVESAATHLQPGERFLLYTDGLIERRTRPLDDGLSALQAIVSRIGKDNSSEDALDALVARMSEHHPAEDDICLLSLTPTASDSIPPTMSSNGTPHAVARKQRATTLGPTATAASLSAV